MFVRVDHPLIAPLPRIVAPVAKVLRRTGLRQLRASWRRTEAALELELPSGELVVLGDRPARRTSASPRIRIHDERMFLRLVLRGELGAGESFVAGEWSTATPDGLVDALRAVLRATSARGVESPLTRLGQLGPLLRHRRAANTHAQSVRNVHAHYDLGNAFYALFLDDDTLAYSCALWTDGVTSLAEAQRRKLDAMCDLLDLGPSDHLLEIGCGWGGMALHAARTRRCRVTAITISDQQYELACARVAAAGLADRVSIQRRDYRDVAGTFDKIVSIEMLEQVGIAYLPRFFDVCARLLRRGGRLAVQTITMPDDRFTGYRRKVDWMQTYIFPGTEIPSLRAIRTASRAFTLARAVDIGPHYAPTLRAWRLRFGDALEQVRALGFDEPFIRTWMLYLAFSEAAFAERSLGDHQLQFIR